MKPAKEAMREFQQEHSRDPSEMTTEEILAEMEQLPSKLLKAYNGISACEAEPKRRGKDRNNG